MSESVAYRVWHCDRLYLRILVDWYKLHILIDGILVVHAAGILHCEDSFIITTVPR